jgi:Na+/alanine symporter
MFSLAIVMGFMQVETIWSIADILNAVLILINLSVLVIILKKVFDVMKSRQFTAQ